MYKNILIGCDIGTSSTKAVAMTAQGEMLASSSEGYGIITQHPSWAEQWPDVWADAAIKTISEVAKKVDTSKIAGICISALYGGSGVMCDEKMEPIRPTIIWMDRRAHEESKWIEKEIGEKTIFDISANGIDSYFGYAKLLWVKNHEPKLFERIRMIFPIHSYIVYLLTGKITVDYCSAGNIGGIYDFDKKCWSEEIAERLSIKLNTLPNNFGIPTKISGTLTEKFSQKLGIPSDVPVCFGTVDCVASMLSAGIVRSGDNAAVLGTSLNWGYISEDRPIDPKLISTPYYITDKKMNYTYGGASTAGALPRWFMNNFINDESSDAYKRLEKEVEKNIPVGSGGLMVLPYFMGERTPIWDENASGLIMGLSLMHTKEHIFRAFLESTAYSLLDIMNSMTNKGKLEKLVLVGGGSKSPLWRKIFADVTGLPVYTPINPVEAPLGDAFMAGLATGLIANTQEIENWVKFNPPVFPDSENHKKYCELFKVYKSLYPSLKGDMKKLRELSY
ncbi:MAG TPA: FGGY-family carbohydrate kinase [Clostridia bacterium]|nr:FGGY-family carbohydrate kinase [Clostridia bacterium]